MCDRWGSDVLLDYVQGRLSPQLAREISEHLAGCARCRISADELDGIAARTHGARVEPGPEADEAMASVIRRVSDRRFANATMPVDESSRPVKPGTRRIRILRRGRGRTPEGSPLHVVWAAAAAVAIAFIVLFAALSGPAEPARRPVTAVAPPAPSAPPIKKIVRSIPRPEPVPPKASPIPSRPGERTLRDPRPFRAPPPAAVPESRPVVPPAPKPPASNPAIVESRPRKTVVEAREAFGIVLQLKGRTDRKGAAVSAGDTVFAGDTLACTSGNLLLELADGSLVALKAGAKVVPEFQDSHVTLALAEGEVACSVRKRPDRRFSVGTAHGSATVRGTIFSVRTTGASSAVTVAEGRVEARNPSGARDVIAGTRSTLRGVSLPSRPERVNAHKALDWAFEAGLRSLDKIWITASEPNARLQPPMTRGRLFAEGSLSGFPLFADQDTQKLPSWKGRFLTADGDEGGWVTFTVDIPETGEWYLWGRMFFPGSGTTLWRQTGPVAENDPNSFYVRVDQGPERVFGNLKREAPGGISWYRRWHWGGDGRVEVGSPAPLKLGTVTRGRHTIRIRNRDGVESASVHLAARLDVLCLTRDPAYVPRDEEVIK